MTIATLVPCPGCGGRNPPDLNYCDWCGRSFLSSGRHISAHWVRLGVSLLFGALVVTMVLLAILNASRPSAARTATPAATASPPPTVSAKAPAVPSVAAPTQPSATATRTAPTPTPVPEPTATPEPLRTARIARTGGAGVFLRREPTAAGPSITALREGTVVTVLRREEVTAARVWRLVRDSRGLEGWILADYLEFMSE